MKNIDEFSYDRELHLIGLIIDNFNQMELLITKIITSYVDPNKEKMDFFLFQLMNNSIISFSSKIKLLIAINKKNKYVKLNRDGLYRLLAIRNAIAHNDVISKYKVIIPKNLMDDNIVECVFVERLKPDGTIETITKNSAFLEFFELHENIMKDLNEIFDKIHGKN